MKLFNSHAHTRFSHDGKGQLNELCETALREKLLGFAVTDHCDCEYASDKCLEENVLASFFESKKYQHKYKDKLIISCGVEMGEALFNQSFAQKIISACNWDVILGSVHAVRIKNIDMPFSTIDFNDFSDELIDKYILQYFVDVNEMLLTQDFDILSHLTVVLRYIVYKYNRKVDITKYYPIITDILKNSITLDKCLEINASGVSDGYLMPDIDILSIYKSLGGTKITIGSDSHTPEALTSGLSDAAAIIKNQGYDTLTYYIDRKPIRYKI